MRLEVEKFGHSDDLHPMRLSALERDKEEWKAAQGDTENAEASKDSSQGTNRVQPRRVVVSEVEGEVHDEADESRDKKEDCRRTSEALGREEGTATTPAIQAAPAPQAPPPPNPTVVAFQQQLAFLRERVRVYDAPVAARLNGLWPGLHYV